MQKYMEKYADILLTKCLKLKKGEPLLIKGPMERYDFVRILVDKAYKMGIKDINTNLTDAYMQHSSLQNLKLEDLKKQEMWSGKPFEVYAKKGGAFLSLSAEYPDLMNDIDASVLTKLQMHSTNESKTFENRRRHNELSWCIASVPTQDWADKLFPRQKDNLNKLWKMIFDICLITKRNPEQALDKKIKISHDRAQKLNNLKLKYLKYSNSLGTDLQIELPSNYIFHNIEMKLADGRIVFPNMPSEEVYSSPLKKGTNGIVYASKPLIHNGKIIDNFWLEFKNGKVVNYGAKKGKEVLESIINFDSNSKYLGEVALVDYNSPISNTNMLFYTTLYDENASCHLALGQAFSDCIKDGENKSQKELEQQGVNQSKTHVDFMVGTKDLKIIGITEKDEEVVIFKNGNCVL